MDGPHRTYAEPATKGVRPAPDSPTALEDLGQRAQLYAQAAARYITARDELADAREAFERAQDRAAKAREVEAV